MQEYEILLNKYSRLGKKVNDLTRIGTLLEALGSPQNELKFIHIAGTNGKGSCAQMLSDALACAGYKTGLFTSPYILKYNDRIRINNEEISDDKLNILAKWIEQNAPTSLPFSQFEITQAMAFEHFRREGCDIVVLEAGLGGRLDSTNVIDAPLVSIITSISLDHTAILGDTIEQIAEQKAGIIKQGSPVVLAMGIDKDCTEIFSRHANKCDSKLATPDENALKVKSCTAFGSKFEYKGENYSVKMGGFHQIKNALTVIEAAKILSHEGFLLTRKDIDRGLSAQVLGRIQLMNDKPLIILDGGHNPEGIEALTKTLEKIPCKKRAVIGMLADKDVDKASAYISRAADSFICVGSFYPRAMDADELAKKLTLHGANAIASELDACKAVRQEILALSDDEALVICGSLFLASIFADGKTINKALKERDEQNE